MEKGPQAGQNLGVKTGFVMVILKRAKIPPVLSHKENYQLTLQFS